MIRIACLLAAAATAGCALIQPMSATTKLHRMFDDALTAEGRCDISVVNQSDQRNVHLECSGSPLYDAQVLSILNRFDDSGLPAYRTRVQSKLYAGRQIPTPQRLSDHTQHREGRDSKEQLAEELAARRISSGPSVGDEIVPLPLAIGPDGLAQPRSPEPPPASDHPFDDLDSDIVPLVSLSTLDRDDLTGQSLVLLELRRADEPPSKLDQRDLPYLVYSQVSTPRGVALALFTPPRPAQEAQALAEQLRADGVSDPLVISVAGARDLIRAVSASSSELN